MDIQSWRREALQKIADEFNEAIKTDKTAKPYEVVILKARLIKGVCLN